MLRCIRCGACMNHCPVYQKIGGHAYGWVYPGPMGSVLTPVLFGLENSADLPNASTLCGACASVCPVRIPLPKLLRQWRERAFAHYLGPQSQRLGFTFWGFFARRPQISGPVARIAVRALALLSRSGKFRSLPFASGWTAQRDFPAPQGETFQAQFAARKKP